MKNLLTLMAAIFLISCAKTSEDALVEDSPSEEILEVAEQSAIEKETIDAPVANSLTCVGRTILSPASQREVYGRVDAFVKKVHIQEGQYIARGQTLVTLESPDFARLQRDYLMAKTEYLFQKKTFDRSKVLVDQESISLQDFDEIVRDHDASLTLYRGLRAELQSIGFSVDDIDGGQVQTSLEVRSLASGQIDFLNVVNGTRIDSEDLLLSMWEPDGILVELYMLAEDAASVSRGDQFSFVLPGRPTEFIGTIKYKSMVVDEQNYTVSLYASIQESHEEIGVGETVFAQFSPKK